MFQNPKGRLVRTLPEAEEYLFEFIAENRRATEKRTIEKSHDFDLYLPWLAEILDNIHEQENEPFTMEQLHRLYMDAAWELVMTGFLRPGPRAINGDAPSATSYGQGFALTTKGEDRLRQQPQSEADPRD